ncbi:MAG TPA: LacI family DNA-binding transcriptional regulator [Terriglobales bacterium]
MAIGIKDVAARAGVSTATVSHVLNGNRPTRPTTRQRVLQAANALGYAQNQAARNLAVGRSSLFGLVISDIRNPFFPEISAAFQDQALLHDMDAVVLNTNYDDHRMLNSVKRLIGLQVAGVAVLTSEIDPAVTALLEEREIAAVYLDLGKVDRLVANISIDYEHGIAEALEYLGQLGHRRIAYIGGPPHLLSARRRKQAFLDSMRATGLEAGHAIDADFGVKGGYFACSKLLAASTESVPTAIVAANDLTAIGVLHRAHDGNLRVPEDLSVIGFDDILMAEFTQPALTTVAVPRSEIGRTAFQALWSMLGEPGGEPGAAGREFRLGTRLIKRQSALPPRTPPEERDASDQS